MQGIPNNPTSLEMIQWDVRETTADEFKYRREPCTCACIHYSREILMKNSL